MIFFFVIFAAEATGVLAATVEPVAVSDVPIDTVFSRCIE